MSSGEYTDKASSSRLTSGGRVSAAREAHGATAAADRDQHGANQSELPASTTFAKTCSGTVRLNFSRAPSSGISYFIVLNAGNINGAASTTGGTSLDIPISGQTVSCPFTNPSNLIVYLGTSTGNAEASLNFN